ncbi:hypothetical protein Tco_0449992, partial [Tanacetum coccineum]
MSANDNFSLHDDEELSLHDDASLDGSVPASNKGDAPAKPPQIITTNTLSNIKLPVLQKDELIEYSQSNSNSNSKFGIRSCVHLGERLARCTALPVLSSPPLVPSPLLPSSGCPTQIQTLRMASTQSLVDVVTAALPSPPLPPL